MYDVDRIEYAMKLNFLTPVRLAEMANLSPATVCRIFKTRKGSPGAIGKIAKVLRLRPEEVVIAPVTEKQTTGPRNSKA